MVWLQNNYSVLLPWVPANWSMWNCVDTKSTCQLKLIILSELCHNHNGYIIDHSQNVHVEWGSDVRIPIGFGFQSGSMVLVELYLPGLRPQKADS